MKLNFPDSDDDEIASAYSVLVAALRARGFQPYMNDRLQLMVARERPARPSGGNCFFILWLQQWYLTTMGDLTYLIPHAEPPIDICLDLLDFADVLADVPHDLQLRYGLSKLNTVQREILDERIDRAESTFPPSVDFEAFVAEMIGRNFIVERSVTGMMCAVADARARCQLWFTLHSNHWYVTTTSGVGYACWDEQVVGLCIYALRCEPPVLDRFPDRFVHGYHMRELSESEKKEISPL